MKCEYEYCIYNKEDACILDEIEMNFLGQCGSCIIVTIPKEELNKYKKVQFQKIKNRYEDLE